MFSVFRLSVFQLVLQQLFEDFALHWRQISSFIFVIDREKPKLVTA